MLLVVILRQYWSVCVSSRNHSLSGRTIDHLYDSYVLYLSWNMQSHTFDC